MSSPDVIADLDSHQNNSSSSIELVSPQESVKTSTATSLIARTFRFDGEGSLKDRLLTALIVLGVALVISILSIKVPHGGIIAVTWAASVVILSVFEVVRLFARDFETLRYQPIRGAVLFLILALPGLAATWSGLMFVLRGSYVWPINYAGLVLGGLALVVYQVVHGRRDIANAARDGERSVTAFLLVSICAPQLILLSSLPRGVQIAWWMVAVVALNDAAAYFVGRSLGKNKMAAALSPNKTVEGSVAGLFVGSLAGVLFWNLLIGIPVSWGLIAVISLLASVAAQAADLSKSYLKRIRGVKDTGAFFPGHGGVLDRFDGIIGASPVILLAFLSLGLI